ncbi:hypothetical protein LINPERPRIM_LOCUS40933, partial [Linum perenne]
GVYSGEGTRVGSLDLCSHSFRVRGCFVSLSFVPGFARCHWRLSVSRGDKSHFVMLEVGQVRWLKNVLTVVSWTSWKLPARCSTSASREVVVIGGWRTGVRMLQILEKCRDGKMFFVLVLVDSNSDGWKMLVGVLSMVVEGRWESQASLVEEGSRGRSFAEVMAPGVLSREGESNRVLGEEWKVKVGEARVREMLRLLRKGLVFRLERPEWGAPDWSQKLDGEVFGGCPWRRLSGPWVMIFGCFATSHRAK